MEKIDTSCFDNLSHKCSSLDDDTRKIILEFQTAFHTIKRQFPWPAMTGSFEDWPTK